MVEVAAAEAGRAEAARVAAVARAVWRAAVRLAVVARAQEGLGQAEEGARAEAMVRWAAPGPALAGREAQARSLGEVAVMALAGGDLAEVAVADSRQRAREEVGHAEAVHVEKAVRPEAVAMARVVEETVAVVERARAMLPRRWTPSGLHGGQ